MSNLAKYLRPEIIEQISRLDLRARFVVEGFLAGLHASPLQGAAVDFAEHRKYVQGDDPRGIDWSVFARTDRLFIRKYAVESRLACHILVDASASMGYVGWVDSAGMPLGSHAADASETKLSYAINLAAALGFLITKQQDAVGLGVISDGLRSFVPAKARVTHLMNLLAVLASTSPGGETGLADGIHAAMRQIPHRGLIIVISDLLTDADWLSEALHHVRFRGHDLIVMHVLDAREAVFAFDGTLRLEDPESGEAMLVEARGVREAYVDGIRRWRDRLESELSAMRADYVALDTATAFDRALVELLIRRSRRG